MANSAIDFAKALPAEIEGFRKSGQPDVFTPKTLFHYINGGAELYISYSFRQLTALNYSQAGGAEIKVDIFDMGHSYNAFGIFAHGRESLQREVGQGSEYAAGLLNFFRDRYYVSLLAYPESQEKKRVVYELARRIDQLIGKDGPLPPILNLLPTENLITHSVRYFHHHNWLNTHCFVSTENILHIDEKTEAVLARYRDPTGTWFVVLVLYPDADRAEAARTSFIKKHPPGVQDGKWSGVRRKDKLVIVVLQASQKQTVDHMLNAIQPGAQ
jgi:hypothetical protein